jgi:hypothetical protein
MFQHVVTLCSFVFAIALTHIFASATELIRERGRVVFSWLLGLWMLNSALSLLVNWISLLLLEKVKHWSIGEILNQLSWVIPQYFTASLVSMRVPESGTIDLPDFYEKQRPVLFSAYVLLMVTSMTANFFDRNNFETWKPSDWIGADLLVLPMLIAAVVAGWAKPRSLQWLAALGMVGLQAWFLVAYSV